MVAAQSNTYLIVAKYNYEKWKALVEQGGKDVDYAERAAEMLFPEYPIPLFKLTEGKEPESFRTGVEFVGTFQSDIFARLRREGLQPVLDGEETLTPREKVKRLEPIIARGLPKPPVGWLAVVEQSEAGAFIQDMSAYGGYLWDMYDIEIRMIPDNWTKEDHIDPLGPLNDDKTTNDVYLNMSIRNWS